MRIAGTLILVLSIAATSGCGHHFAACKQDDKDYAGAKELPPLTAPPGLEVPNTRNSLKVPPLNTPERVRARDESCLDSPPPFATAKTTDVQKPK